MGKLVVVVGGQYGSEAKGSVVAHLTRTEPNVPMVVRVGGPNAGHTVYDDEGKRWPMRQIPVGFVRSDAVLAIGAGSLVNQTVLQDEIAKLSESGHMVLPQLYIDRMATVLEPEHIQHEQTSGITDRIGSTGKGIGIARAGRIMRTAKTVRDVEEIYRLSKLGAATNVAELIRHWLGPVGGTVILEGTQGFALGLHSDFYPYATSQDCTALDILAQAGISPWDRSVTELEIWVVFRTYPIRVAGHSGPMDRETSWEELGRLSDGYIKPEHTTVTQKVRRVGAWDPGLAMKALLANGGSQNPQLHTALMMCDYLDPTFAGLSSPRGLQERLDLQERLEQLDNAVWPLEHQLKHKFELLGTSPQSIVDRRERV